MLSPAEERIWFVSSLYPDCPAYNVQLGVQFEGDISIAALSAALARLAARHDALRTYFPARHGTPTRVVLSDITLPLTIETVVDDVPERTRRRAVVDGRGVFRLDEAPLWRAFFVCHTAASTREWSGARASAIAVFITLHHIVADGPSLRLLSAELCEFYNAIVSGDELAPAALAPSCAAAAAGLAERVHATQSARDLAHWISELQEAPSITEAPSDFPRPALPTFRGALHRKQLPASLTARLEAFASEHRATLYHLLLSAHAALLFRYSWQRDLVIGLADSGRDQIDSDAIVGFFANTLPLRIRIADGETFASLVGQCKRVVTESVTHGGTPFQQIVDTLGLMGERSRNPLFQTMCLLSYEEPLPPVIDGLACGVDVDLGISRFDLTLRARRSRRDLSIELEYSSDLFEPRSIDRFMTHVVTLLEAGAARPDAPLEQLPMLTAVDIDTVMSWGCPTAVASLDNRCMHEIVECQADVAPDRLAAIAPADGARDHDRMVSYRELDERSNQLAHALLERGVQPGALVPICLVRSIEMVVAMLGCLKSGAAYVPLDPSDPDDRLRQMLQELEPPFVLTHASCDHRLARVDARRLAVDAVELGRYPTTRPNVASDLDRPCYAIFTSGSTGGPKGVVVTHRSLVNHERWFKREYAIGPDDHVLQKSAYTFDGSVNEFFAPLASGATLIFAAPERHRDPTYLTALVQRYEITSLTLVPSLLRALVAEPSLAECRSLRFIICGGEPLTADLAIRLRERLPAIQLHNLYGPTEATINATAWTWDPVYPYACQPIGRPIDNTSIYILGRDGQPAPIMGSGEIFIGGAAVARGYHARPDLTRTRFLPDPFRAASATMYRSGDLGRFRPDGNIEFLGRLDDQVKLRGFRVELAEVCQAILRHPGVKEADVLLQQDSNSLIAFVAPSETTKQIDIKTFVARWLPRHMIPSRVVHLDRLPLTASCKIDRHQLRSLAERVDAPRGGQALDCTPLQRAAADIWTRLLKVHPGLDDSFFDLGGHSLLAVQLLGALRTELGLRVSLGEFWERPTIRATVDAAARRTLREGPTVLRRGGPRPPVFLVHPVGGLTACYASLVSLLGTERAYWGIDAMALTHKRYLSIPELAAAYISEIRRVQPAGPFVLGGWSFGGLLAYEMAGQLADQGEAVGALFMIDSQPSRHRLRDDARETEARCQLLGVLPRLFESQGFDRLSGRDIDTPDEVFVGATAQQLRTLSAPASALEPTDLEDVLVMLLHHFRARIDYEPRRYSAPIVFFEATESAASGGAWGHWAPVVSPRWKRVPVAGDHFSMVRGEGIVKIAGVVTQLLAAVR